MTRDVALAQARRRILTLVEQLPAPYRPDVAAEWSKLLASIEGRTERRALDLISDWIIDMEIVISTRLANAPLTYGRAA